MEYTIIRMHTGMNNICYKYLCFDMDGVIFSSDDIIGEAYQEAVRQVSEKFDTNLAMPSHDLIMDQIGQPSKKIIQNLFPSLAQIHQAEIGMNVLENLVEFILAGKGKIYNGIVAVLEKLSGARKLFLASNAREVYAKAILKYYKLDTFFSDSLFLSDKIVHKGEIIERYIRKYSIVKDEILMIGDRSSDRDAAKYAGCDFLGVIYGHGSRDELSGAKYFAKNPGDILSIIDKF